FHCIFRNNFIIDRTVFPCSTVEGSSGILVTFEELFLRHVFSFLKHHMIKVMIKIGSSMFLSVLTIFILSSYVIIEFIFVLMQYHMYNVFQIVYFKFNSKFRIIIGRCIFFIAT